MALKLSPAPWMTPLPGSWPDPPPDALRVVVLGHHYADSFAENIAATLTLMGARATAVDSRGRLSLDMTAGSARRLMPYLLDASRRITAIGRTMDVPVTRALQVADPQLVLSTDGYLPHGIVDRWRTHTPRAVWALWYPDHLANLGAQLPFAAPWDHLFFKDPYLVDLLRSRTAIAAHYLPEACNPHRHRPEQFASPEERARYCCDVALAGNIYPYRARILETLPPGLDLRLYGNLPSTVTSPRVRGAFRDEYVTGRAKSLAYRGAKIVLNTLHYAEIHAVNARLFEATGCGAFVVTHASPGLSSLYEPEREVVAVDNAADLRRAVTDYLGDDAGRQRIADAGQARAHRDHTYERRLRALLGVCGLAV